MTLGPEWVSASAIRNFCNRELLLDWLNLYGKESGFKPDDERPGYAPETDFGQFIFEKGREFEAAVMRCLVASGLEILDLSEHARQARETEAYERTAEALRAGVPIVYQGVLHHAESQTYGVPDLLVRSDVLNRLVENPTLNAEESDPRHYRVVDIKFGSLKLGKGGVIGESGSSKYRKAQLFIYNRALGAVQGFVPPVAYLLGRNWEHTSKGETSRGKGCLERLGACDMADAELEQRVADAADWVRRVRSEGEVWSVLPQPSIPELRPGKPGANDGKWRKAKSEIAETLKDSIRLWQVGIRGRDDAVQAGCVTFTDGRLDAAMLGVTGPKKPAVLDQILDMVRSKNGPKIAPASITSEREVWDAGRALDFFVDFETVSNLDDDFEAMPGMGCQPLIFMVGCGHIEQGKWSFECFIADSLTESAEAQVIEDWMAHMESVTARLASPGDVPLVFHWSPAEDVTLTTQYNSACARQPHKNWPQPNWYDFLNRVVKAEPVIVKDALMFGLKPTANAMFKHGFIEEQWTDGVGGGMDAMVGAWRCHAKAMEQDCSMRDLPLMQSIAKYNETDCKVMQQIIAYLRAHH